MINILMNQKPGLTDSVSCPTMEIPGRQITYNSGAKEKHQISFVIKSTETNLTNVFRKQLMRMTPDDTHT